MSSEKWLPFYLDLNLLTTFGELLKWVLCRCKCTGGMLMYLLYNLLGKRWRVCITTMQILTQIAKIRNKIPCMPLDHHENNTDNMDWLLNIIKHFGPMLTKTNRKKHQSVIYIYQRSATREFYWYPLELRNKIFAFEVRTMVLQANIHITVGCTHHSILVTYT